MKKIILILLLLVLITACSSSVPNYPKIEVNVGDDAFLGGETAKVTIIEFSDYLCPFCKKAEDTMKQINQEYSDQVKIVFRDFPVHGEKAEQLAVMTECAKSQGKFWEVHNKIFEVGYNLEEIRNYVNTLEIDIALYDICVANNEKIDEVKQDLEEGKTYGIQGTPTFFINGYKLEGAQPFEKFKEVIEYELNK